MLHNRIIYIFLSIIIICFFFVSSRIKSYSNIFDSSTKLSSLYNLTFKTSYLLPEIEDNLRITAMNVLNDSILVLGIKELNELRIFNLNNLNLIGKINYNSTLFKSCKQ